MRRCTECEHYFFDDELRHVRLRNLDGTYIDEWICNVCWDLPGPPVVDVTPPDVTQLRLL